MVIMMSPGTPARHGPGPTGVLFTSTESVPLIDFFYTLRCPNLFVRATDWDMPLGPFGLWPQGGGMSCEQA
jgi:hypothetical protein